MNLSELKKVSIVLENASLLVIRGGNGGGGGAAEPAEPKEQTAVLKEAGAEAELK